MPSKKDYTSIQVSGVKYMNINNCWCAIWKSYALILKIHIQESK
jgi:hypothetical protein